jgi:hypothetical protein
MSDEGEEITPEYLQSLLDQARRNAREEAQRVKMLQEERETVGFGEQDVIKIGDGEKEKEETYVWWVVFAAASDLCMGCRPLPPLDPGVLPSPYFEFGKVRHQAPTSVRDPDVAQAEVVSSLASIPAPPEDPNAHCKQLTRKERKAVRHIYCLMRQLSTPGYS